MAKTGRNDPCPCGSGQKYKRCCLARDEAAARAAARARVAASLSPVVEIVAEDEGLDDASNRVIDLIDAGPLDDADAPAHDLLTRYPEVHDGLERIAVVAAERSDRARAAEYYRKAAAFVQARREWYHPEVEDYLRASRNSVELPNEESGDHDR